MQAKEELTTSNAAEGWCHTQIGNTELTNTNTNTNTNTKANINTNTKANINTNKKANINANINCI